MPNNNNSNGNQTEGSQSHNDEQADSPGSVTLPHADFDYIPMNPLDHGWLADIQSLDELFQGELLFGMTQMGAQLPPSPYQETSVDDPIQNHEDLRACLLELEQDTSSPKILDIITRFSSVSLWNRTYPEGVREGQNALYHLLDVAFKAKLQIPSIKTALTQLIQNIQIDWHKHMSSIKSTYFNSPFKLLLAKIKHDKFQSSHIEILNLLLLHQVGDCNKMIQPGISILYLLTTSLSSTNSAYVDAYVNYATPRIDAIDWNTCYISQNPTSHSTPLTHLVQSIIHISILTNKIKHALGIAEKDHSESQALLAKNMLTLEDLDQKSSSTLARAYLAAIEKNKIDIENSKKPIDILKKNLGFAQISLEKLSELLLRLSSNISIDWHAGITETQTSPLMILVKAAKHDSTIAVLLRKLVVSKLDHDIVFRDQRMGLYHGDPLSHIQNLLLIRGANLKLNSAPPWISGDKDNHRIRRSTLLQALDLALQSKLDLNQSLSKDIAALYIDPNPSKHHLNVKEKLANELLPTNQDACRTFLNGLINMKKLAKMTKANDQQPGTKEISAQAKPRRASKRKKVKR